MAGAAVVVLSGFQNPPTATTVTPRKGKPYPDTDSSVDQDYYFA